MVAAVYRCDVKRGEGGSTLSVIMTLSVLKSVWRCPLIRSAISRIHERPECQVKSKRVASVIKDADDLLKVISEPINLDHFDTFSRDLVAKLESCFQGEFVNRERVWKAFHKIRTQGCILGHPLTPWYLRQHVKFCLKTRLK